MAVPRSRKLAYTGLIAASFVVGLFAAGALDLPRRSAAQQPANYATTTSAGAKSPAVQSLQDLSDAFASITERIEPSVVYVKTERTERVRQAHPQVPEEFRQFFKDFPGQPNQPQQPGFSEASGSGFIVSPDGYILTNNHVVDGADQVTVRLFDRREFTARVVGTDENTDVAVLKIDARNLTPVPLGNSDQARVGRMGAGCRKPPGRSADVYRHLGDHQRQGPDAWRCPIQTRAASRTSSRPTPRSTRGTRAALCSSVAGEVVGINTAIASETGYYSGYGFAIPINMAKQVMDQIIAHGRVERAALGIRVRDATANDAAYVGLPDIRGVRVEDFGSDDSPARRSGLEPGDVIVSVDGQPVQYVGQLQQRIAFRKPGDVVSVEVARKGGVRKTFPGDASVVLAIRTSWPAASRVRRRSPISPPMSPV